MPTFIQPSFAHGVVAPSIYGRVDTAAYQTALRQARNAIIHPYGGVSNRAGLEFIGPAKEHGYAPRLVPFQFKTLDDYMIEVGNFYARFIRNDAYITEAAKVITAITQASPGVITSAAHGFTTGQEVYVADVVGMTRVNGRRFLVGTATTNTFQLKDQVTGLAVNTTTFPAYVSGGTVARIYEIPMIYASADLSVLKWVQSADVMTLAHNGYPVQQLSRTDHTAWTVVEPTFQPAQAFPTAVAVSVTATGSVPYRYQVTATNVDTGEESLPGINTSTQTITAITKANPAVVTSTSHGYTIGDEVYLSGIVGMTQLNGRRFIVAGALTNTFQLQGEDSTGYTTYVSGGTSNQTFVRVTGDAVMNNTITFAAAAGASKYSVYREDNGIFGFVGDTELLTFGDSNTSPDLGTTPPKARDPFLGAGNWPGTVKYYEQRRVFGGTTNKPDTSDYSQTGNHSNFSKSSPLQQDDAITATMYAQQVNEIRHYLPGNDLVVLTSGGEWRVNSGSDAAFAADTMRQKPQSYWGASHHMPLVVGNTIIFVEENESRIRTLGYSLQIDGYTGTDLTVLASHLLFSSRVADMAWARMPDGTAHVIRTDGHAMALTFQQEQQVTAWAEWDTLGNFERVASLRHAEGEPDDRVYFVVQRKINGQTVRYIEKLHSRRFTDVRDCFFVDCGLSYDDPVNITNITTADPIVVSAAAHGYSNGDTVDIFDVDWEPQFDEYDNETNPDQLNGRRYVVASATTDTFALHDDHGNPIDGSVYESYVEGGTVRKAVLTFSGLDHLEGRSVVCLADGNAISGLTVVNGSVTLKRRASRIHIGLKYVSDIETLDIELPSNAGTRQGQKVKVNSVIVRFEKSRGIFVGQDSFHLEELKQRKFERMGDPTALLTGDTAPIPLPNEWNSNGRIFLRQRYPLPMTILAVIPDITLGGTSRDE